MKQKIIRCQNSEIFEADLNIAIGMGWLVQTIAVNAETGTWFAVLYKNCAA